MELCAAKSLQSVMKAFKRGLSEAELGCALRQTVRALVYVHERRRIHRDIKSGNLLLQADGSVKLCDFGVAGELTTEAKRHTMIGSPYWMAPEVIDDAGHDQKADVWSLGITAIELAETVPPHFSENPMRAVFLIPNSEPPGLQHPERYSEQFRDFLRCCLVKDPDARHSTAQLMQHPFITGAERCHNRHTHDEQQAEQSSGKEADEEVPCVLEQLALAYMSSTDGMETAASPNIVHREQQAAAASGGGDTLGAGTFDVGALGTVSDLELSTADANYLSALGSVGAQTLQMSLACPRCAELREKVAALEKQVSELTQSVIELTEEAAYRKGKVEFYQKMMQALPRP